MGNNSLNTSDLQRRRRPEVCEEWLQSLKGPLEFTDEAIREVLSREKEEEIILNVFFKNSLLRLSLSSSPGEH